MRLLAFIYALFTFPQQGQPSSARLLLPQYSRCLHLNNFQDFILSWQQYILPYPWLRRHRLQCAWQRMGFFFGHQCEEILIWTTESILDRIKFKIISWPRMDVFHPTASFYRGLAKRICCINQLRPYQRYEWLANFTDRLHRWSDRIWQACSASATSRIWTWEIITLSVDLALKPPFSDTSFAMLPIKRPI